MEQIIRMAAQTLTATESTLYNNANGAVIKTILLYNSNTINSDVTLVIDNVTFLFSLATKETKILNSPIVSNSVKATGAGISIHISGIQLGA